MTDTVTLPRAEFEEAKDIIESIKNQTMLSPYARAGDPAQNDDLIVEALWSGALKNALAILEKHGGAK